MDWNTDTLFRKGKYTSPCIKCDHREVGCHGKCEAYKNYSEDRKKHYSTDYFPHPSYNKTKF